VGTYTEGKWGFPKIQKKHYMDRDNDCPFQREGTAQTGRQCSYDLESSLINCCNEDLYNLPSVPQSHIFSNVKDVT